MIQVCHFSFIEHTWSHAVFLISFRDLTKSIQTVFFYCFKNKSNRLDRIHFLSVDFTHTAPLILISISSSSLPILFFHSILQSNMTNCQNIYFVILPDSLDYNKNFQTFILTQFYVLFLPLRETVRIENSKYLALLFIYD